MGPKPGDDAPHTDGDSSPRPYRKFEIAVPTTERWKVAEEVRGSVTGAASEDTGPRIIRVRASQRDAAKKAPPVRRVEAPLERPSEAASKPTALHTDGRSGLAVEEELQRLLRERPELAPIHVPDAELVTAFARLGEGDQERWLGMRNGRPRPLRPSTRVDVATARAALDAVRPSATDRISVLAIERAIELLGTDPNGLWNVAVEALLEVRARQLGATPRGLVEILPADSPCPFELPCELALPLLPLTARWRVGRFLGSANVDRKLKDEAARRSLTVFPLDLREALVALARKVEQPVPKVKDDAAWTRAALFALRELVSRTEGRGAVLASRPAEVSAYVAVGRDLMEAHKPWLAELAFSAGTHVGADPKKARLGQAEVRETAAQVRTILVTVRTDKGFGSVLRVPGADSKWSMRWTDHETWPDEVSVERLGLPDNVIACLLEQGHQTVGALRRADRRELLGLEAVGRAGLLLIERALSSSPS